LSPFHHFQEDVSQIELPAKFTYPFRYDPHPLCRIAVKELQLYLENQTDFQHDFGLHPHPDSAAKGKMFGVLVVKNPAGELGYLTAFSGSFADKSLPAAFVPPLFDLHAQHNFFKKGEAELNKINRKIEALEQAPQFMELQNAVESKTQAIEAEAARLKASLKRAKKIRKQSRQEAEQTFSKEDFESFKKQLEKESFVDRYFGKGLSAVRQQELLPLQKELEAYTAQIAELKTTRKQKSARLQQEIFDQYQFLNKEKEPKALTDIFPHTAEQQPPGGAGDCAAPRLLQYAFAHAYTPIAMAEFWWGASPKTEVRKHKQFYPACQGRCKPILAHMLQGMEMEENPLHQPRPAEEELEIIFEDEWLIVVNKPAGFLSVPGKEIEDSVYTRIKRKYPEATGPLIVHRLDMATSGILVLTKTKEAHKIVQSQFINRTVKKRYVALVEGIVEQDAGYIELPLRVDLDARPR